MGRRRRRRTPLAQEQATGWGRLCEVVELIDTDHVEAEEIEGDAIMGRGEDALEDVKSLARDGHAVAKKHGIPYVGTVAHVGFDCLVPGIVASDDGYEDNTQRPHIVCSRGVRRVDAESAEALCGPLRCFP